jgi:hypothetical protein
MDKERLKRNLEYTKKKHEHDKLNTFDTDISMLCFDTLNVLDNCIEIPNGATNGDVIKTLWNVKTWMYDDDTICVEYEGIIGIKLYPLSWWNAPYKKVVQ